MATAKVTTRESDLLWQAHQDLHTVDGLGHVREHELTAVALIKAETAMERRLEGMNEFRAQLNSQAGTFVTREIFDRYIKEHEEKFNTGVISTAERFSSAMATLSERHDKDIDALEKEIQTERELRKATEGSMNAFKYLATFFGAGGIGAIILLFATKVGV